MGPVLAEVRAGLGMGAASAGLLTSLPVLAFAVFGALAPALASRIGLHRVTLLALVCVIAGLGTRVLVDHEASFLALSMLALAGMAVANVVLPSLVKLHFPDRVGLVTAIYTTALSIGLTAALWLTVPISDALGDWRGGLGAWAVDRRRRCGPVDRADRPRPAPRPAGAQASATSRCSGPGWVWPWRCSSASSPCRRT